jgi:hypothetical protein
VTAPAIFNRRQRRAGMSKKGYGGGYGGACPHVLGRFTTKHDDTSTLVRATFPCSKPGGHEGPHRTGGGKEWT